VTEPTPALSPLVAAWCAAVGAVVGSFLNVVIARVPARQSIVHPGSRCASCGVHIRWYDNIPIVSWFVLRARCRVCGARISARYPTVEALGAAVALVAWARHGFAVAAAAELAFAAALITLAFIDIDTWLLPNVITWPLIAFGLLMGLLGVTPARSLSIAAYGAGLGFAAFAVVSWLGQKAFRKEALGFGDVWLLAALGAWMGYRALLPVVLLASLQGAVVGLALLAAGRGEPGPASPVEPSLPTPGEPLSATDSRDVERSEDDWVPPKNAVPFGPFLVVGALEWLWVGGPLAQAVPVLRLFR
jgi:leader peptidase (prepilin peptidase) / N-methyltransferase